MKVDTFKHPHKKLKPDAWVQHIQKMWADPAKDGAWGHSTCGALSADTIGVDPWDLPGKMGKKAHRETSQQ